MPTPMSSGSWGSPLDQVVGVGLLASPLDWVVGMELLASQLDWAVGVGLLAWVFLDTQVFLAIWHKLFRPHQVIQASSQEIPLIITVYLWCGLGCFMYVAYAILPKNTVPSLLGHFSI